MGLTSLRKTKPNARLNHTMTSTLHPNAFCYKSQYLHELQDERSTCNNVIPTRQKVLANQGFQHRRLAATLAAHNSNLREINIAARSKLGKYILQLIHHRDD